MIAFLGLTYPLLGISEGVYETLKTKIDPGYFLKFRCPLAQVKIINTNRKIRQRGDTQLIIWSVE